MLEKKAYCLVKSAKTITFAVGKTPNAEGKTIYT